MKLLDFGIAKGMEIPTMDSGTKTGAMIGSPFYMSPEQILGSRNVDHRSDLWSVGVVAYEALTGRKPFDAETMGGLAIRIHSEPLPFPTALMKNLSPAVDAWFHRACARSATDRFNSAKDMATALAAALGGEMPHSVAMPRSSTGSNGDHGHHDTLVTGATTEAGVVRTTPSVTTRNRVLALIAFAAVLVAATFIGVTAVRRGDSSKSGHATAEPAQTTAPPVSIATRSAEPATPASAPVLLLSVTSSQPTPPTTKAAGRYPPQNAPRPTGSSTSVRPPLPSAATAAPTPTGHDIF